MEKTSRRFGVEIEMYPENGQGMKVTPSYVAGLLVSAGINAMSIFYNHDDSDTIWKVTTDSSCSHDTDYVYKGIEVVSPRLSGDQGIADLKKVCEVLHSAGMKIKKSCGLHVHVDANDLSRKSIASVTATYARYEKFFDAIQPESRRHNGMCKSIAAKVLTNDDYSARQFAINPFQRFVGDRYHKVNLEAYSRHGTIEFRQHSGTVESGKIVPWVYFLINFVEVTKSWMVNVHPKAYSFARIMKNLQISIRGDESEKAVYSYIAARFAKFSPQIDKNSEI